MQPHIAKTIEDIDLKIGFLQRLKSALENFDSPTNFSAPAAPGQNTQIPATPPRKMKAMGRRKKAEPNGAKINRAHRKNRFDLQDRIRELVLDGKIAEPFHSLQVADALKEDRVPVTNTLTKLCASGELQLAGKDGLKKLYRKTAKLEAVEPNAGEAMLADIHKEIEATKPANIYE